MDYQDEGEEIINNQFNQICDIMLKTKLKSFTSSLEMVYFNGPKYRELTNETLFPFFCVIIYKTSFCLLTLQNKKKSLVVFKAYGSALFFSKFVYIFFVCTKSKPLIPLDKISRLICETPFNFDCDYL